VLQIVQYAVMIGFKTDAVSRSRQPGRGGKCPSNLAESGTARASLSISNDAREKYSLDLKALRRRSSHSPKNTRHDGERWQWVISESRYPSVRGRTVLGESLPW
jgi:hypothetical protein